MDYTLIINAVVLSTFFGGVVRVFLEEAQESGVCAPYWSVVTRESGLFSGECFNLSKEFLESVEEQFGVADPSKVGYNEFDLSV